MKGMAEELYGIKNTNVETVLTKNIFTTYIPVSTSLYLENFEKKIPVLCVRSGELKLEYENFPKLIGVEKQDINNIIWRSESRNPTYNKSIRAPGVDMGAVLKDDFRLEFEVKLTVVPTHAENKLTEMNVRQNTQFNFAERIFTYF